MHACIFINVSQTSVHNEDERCEWSGLDNCCHTLFVTNEITYAGDFGNSSVLCIEKAKEKFCYESDKTEHVEFLGKMPCIKKYHK